MIPVTIYVPNDEAKAFELEAFISRRLGGVTLNGICTGVWVEPDQGCMIRDVNRRYVVACNPIQDGPKLQEIISYIKDKFVQQAVYLEYLGHAEIL